MTHSQPGGDAESVVSARRFATKATPVTERLRAWEDWNEQQLFGLRASTLSPDGLLASQANLDVGALHVTEIAGNAHVIERTPDNIASKPVDTVMMCLMLSGEAFVYDTAGHQGIRTGDAVVYDSDTPFLYGFTGNMHQIILEVPRAIFQGRIDEHGVPRPRVLRLADDPATTRWATSAARIMRSGIRNPGVLGEAEAEQLLHLQAYLVNPREAGPEGYLVAAQEYVRARVGVADLSGGRIAAGIGISERHLRRVFADAGLTVAGYVTDMRIATATRLLTDPERAAMSVADVATAVGYVSAAHFSRVFRSQTGFTPTQAREAARG